MCANCSKLVRKTQAAILCGNCASCFHAKCSGLAKDAFNKRNTSTEQWLCLACSLPQISDSFFESSSSSLDVSDPENCSGTQSSETFETLTRHGAKHCVIGSLNINSLCGKFDEVQEWIEAFDILCIQETKIDRSFPDSQFAIKGYIMYRRDRKKGGGGIVVYIRKSLPSYRLKTKTKEMEAILVDFQVGQQHFSLLCGYKPPSVNNNTFTDEMYTLLDAAISNRPNMICLGDLNCDILHPLENGKEGRAWLDICDIYDLQNLITAPTRISRTKQSCIDIIATNVPAFELQSGVLEPGLSDHKLVYTILNRKALKPTTIFTKARCFKSFNDEAFNKDLECVPFNVAYVFDDVDDICWAWEKMYTNVLDDHAPIKSKRCRNAAGKSKFITPEIKKAMCKRNALKRKFNTTRSADDWEAYRSQRNYVVALQRKSIICHFDQLCNSRAGNPREF